MNFKQKFNSFIYEYKLLAQTSTRELWIVYFSKLMEAVSFFAMSIVLTLFLSVDLGLNDISASKIIGIWSATYGILVFFSGAFCDVIGIKTSLIFGFLFLSLGRFILSFFPDYNLVVFVGLPIIALGIPLMVPIKSAAIKKATTRRSRALAFSIYYSVMNFGAFIAGLLVDQLGNFVNKTDVVKISSYRMVNIACFIFTIMGFIAVGFFMRKNSYAEDDIESCREAHPTIMSFFRKIYTSISKLNFWRFIVFLTAMAVLRQLLTHMDTTIPKFMIREIGPMSAIGSITMINGLMLMFLPLIVGGFLNKFSIINTILFGSIISALSPGFLAIKYTYYAKLASFISFGFHPVYIPLILFIIFYSIGEAIWSPKLYEYTSNVAPRGEESTYMSLSALPWYLGKAPASLMSGYLLFNYCPENGARNSEFMWFIIFATSIAAPLIVVAFKKFITGGNKSI